LTAGSLQLSSGNITVSGTASETVALSSSFSTITLQNNGDAVIDGTSGTETINLNGASNATLLLGHGAIDTVNLLGGTNTAILGFTPGSGSLLNVANTNAAANIVLLDGSQTQVKGANLAWGNSSVYVINIGTLSDTSAATAAVAANKAYAVAGVDGSATPLGTGEYVTLIGKDAAGDTLIWFFGSTAGATNGTIPNASLAGSADVNGNHLVDAAELTLIATVVGVAPTSLTAFDLA
jgi:hypothetical protein